jgi:hypothetical protein
MEKNGKKEARREEIGGPGGFLENEATIPASFLHQFMSISLATLRRR